MIHRFRKLAAVPGAVQPVTLEQARAQCRVDCEDEDTLLGIYISVATQAASDRLQRALVPTRYRLTLDAFVPIIDLLAPVTSIDLVQYIDADGTTQTLAPTAYLLDAVSEPGQLHPAPGTTWPTTQERPNAVQVEFTAGYAGSQVPTPIQQWILLAVADLYAHRERSSDKPVVPQNFADALLDTYRIWSL